MPGESTLRRDFQRLQQENKERSEAHKRQQAQLAAQRRDPEEHKRQLLHDRQKRIEEQKEQRRRLEEVIVNEGINVFLRNCLTFWEKYVIHCLPERINRIIQQCHCLCLIYSQSQEAITGSFAQHLAGCGGKTVSLDVWNSKLYLATRMRSALYTVQKV